MLLIKSSFVFIEKSKFFSTFSFFVMNYLGRLCLRRISRQAKRQPLLLQTFSSSNAQLLLNRNACHHCSLFHGRNRTVKSSLDFNHLSSQNFVSLSFSWRTNWQWPKCRRQTELLTKMRPTPDLCLNHLQSPMTNLWLPWMPKLPLKNWQKESSYMLITFQEPHSMEALLSS